MLTKKETTKSSAKTCKSVKTDTPLLNSQEQTNDCSHSSHNSALVCNTTKTTQTSQNSKNTQAPAKTYTTQLPAQQQCCEGTHDKKQNPKTKITVKFDTGFPNQLFIRGKGANLNWDKGQPLKNTKSDEWVWEFEAPFSTCEFKVLINDRIYENGTNHFVNAGSTILYTPSFN